MSSCVNQFDKLGYLEVVENFRAAVTSQYGENVGFANDGPILPDQWGNGLKILVLAKETYGFAGCDHCPVMGMPESWNAAKFNKAIARLAYGIQTSLKDGRLLERNQIFNPGDQKLQDAYSNLAIVEVKKTSNDGSTTRSNDAEIRRHSKEFKDLLRAQVEALAPDVIVCCGTVTYHSLIYEVGYINSDDKELKVNEAGIHKSSVVLHGYHPSASKFNLMDVYQSLLRAFDHDTPLSLG